jgi:integrase
MTALAVERLKESAFVGGVPGLQLMVSPGGTRTWRLFYRLPDGTRRTMTLGRYPAVSLADARARASEALGTASDGVDPRSARIEKATRNALTVDAALDRYLSACAASNDEQTQLDKRRAFANHVRPSVGGRSLPQVTRSDWLALIDALAGKPGMRRNLYAYLRHFLAWALEREMIEAHPIVGVRAPKPVAPRDRILTDYEIKALWALEGDTATLAKLALLTAQRRGSLAAMRWDQIDFEARVWRIPADKMKSGKPHEVPLSNWAVRLLTERPQYEGPFVFGVGSDGARPFDGFSNGMEALRASMPKAKPLWRFHDLRRTAVTLAQRAGCQLDAIRALTQHKMPGVIGVYARHAFQNEKRSVIDGIETEIAGIAQQSSGIY